MADLTSKQRAYLRKLAHRLKPVVFVGTDGVTDAVVASVEEALHTRELLKVKVQQGAPEKAKKTGQQLVAALEGAHIPQTIGRTVVIYREHPDEPEIKLPKAD